MFLLALVCLGSGLLINGWLNRSISRGSHVWRVAEPPFWKVTVMSTDLADSEFLHMDADE